MARYKYDSVNRVEIPIAGGPEPTNFTGTRAEWNALTTAQKAQYKTMDIIGEINNLPIDLVPTSGSTNPVSSGGVYTAIQAATSEIEDPKVYISGVEESSTTSQAYTVGSFLIYNHILYKVIASIALGDTLIPDTNIEATTVGSELTTILDSLTANNTTAGVANVPFRFGVDDSGKFGYIINEGGADTVIPFKSGAELSYDYYSSTQITMSHDYKYFIAFAVRSNYTPAATYSGSGTLVIDNTGRETGDGNNVYFRIVAYSNTKAGNTFTGNNYVRAVGIYELT